MKKPEKFEKEQKRVEKVLNAREDYASHADKRKGKIVNEHTNDEKKLLMIAELEAMEKNPTESTKKFIRDTRYAAEFTFFKHKFEELLERGRDETLEGNYIASMNTNSSGFELYRTTFYEQDYDLSIVNAVDENLESISIQISAYDALQLQLVEAFRVFEEALLSGSAEQSILAFQTVSSVVNEFAVIRNSIVASGLFFQNTFEQLTLEYLI